MNVRQSKVRPLAFLAVVALAAVLISAVVAVDVDAARGARGGGGKGHNGGGGSTTTATLAVFADGVEVTSVPLGTAVDIRGSGFQPNTTYYVGIPFWLDLIPITSDGSGNLSRHYDGLYPAGNYTFAADLNDGTVVAFVRLTVV